ALARLDRAGGAARRASPAATRGAGGPMRPVRPAACSADPVRVTKLALRSIARRWRSLSEEIGDLDRAIEPWSPVPLPGCSGSTEAGTGRRTRPCTAVPPTVGRSDEALRGAPHEAGAQQA